MCLRVDSDNEIDIYSNYNYAENDMTCEQATVYTLKSPMHIFCLVLNILLPGFGTMASSCRCLHAVKDQT